MLQWDLRYALRVVDALAGHVRDEELRARVSGAAAAAWRRVEPLAGELPWQAVHGDVTDDNVVCRLERGLRTPDGIIDFGDLTTSWAVGELAIAITSVLRHAGAEPCSVLPAVCAFGALRPLSAAEATVLWPLVVLRAAVLVVSGEQQAAIDGVNDYVTGALEHERNLFDRATSVPAEVMTGLILAELGLRGGPLRAPSGVVVDLGRTAVLDLSAQSDAVDEGAWLEPGLEDRLAQALLAEGYDAVATRFGEARLTALRVLAGVSPATVATGIDLWTAAPAELPAELTVRRDGNRVHVSLPARGAPEVPPLVRPEYAAGWLTLVADPGPLLGLPETELPETELPETGLPRRGCLRRGCPRRREGDLLGRRAASFAAVQEHYYADPPRIERGWRQHLAATDGRVYLDMVNNVAVLGQSHPRVEAAVARQLRRLNTNSRFNYDSVVEYAARLAGLVPAALEGVFVVNSGSEAVDLALRLALVYTGRQDVVAVLEACRGWTYAADAVFTCTGGQPDLRQSKRPACVHIVDAPNPYRGRYGGSAAVRYSGHAVRAIGELAAAGRLAVAFLAEPYSATRAAAAPRWVPSRGLRRGSAARRPLHRGRDPGRLWPPGRLILGFRAARRDAEHRHGGEGDGQRLSTRGGDQLARDRRTVPRRGILFLLDRRRAGVQRGRPDGPRRDQGRGTAGQRGPGGRAPEGAAGGAGRSASLIGAVHGSGLYLGVEFVRDRDTLAPPPRRPRPSATGCSGSA